MAISLTQINDMIVDESYQIVPNSTTTICTIRLPNDFIVVGESSATHREEFDAEMGEKYARKNAIDKIFAMEGYRAKVFPETQDRAAKVIESIARFCHDINKAYCSAMGDDSQPEFDDAPQWQIDSAMNGVKFHLANPDASPSASHESWYAQKESEGWVYGEVKDPELRTHPCMVQYDELPKEQKAKDYLFKQTIHSCKTLLGI